MNTPVQKSSGANQPVADAVVVETVVDEPKRLSASNDPRTEPFEINEARPRRWGWLLLLFGFGGFVAWATLAPLDEGVTSPGSVVVTGNRKSVQSLASGIVTSLGVKEGDTVKAGQVLIRLDATPPRTQLEMARGQLFSTQAFEARLIAEQMGAGAITFPPDLMAAKSDPRAAAAMALQQRLFTARRETLAGEIAVVRDNIAGLEAQMSGLIEARKSKEEQLRLLREEIKGQRELANDGYLPRNRLFEQERLLAALNAQTSEDIGNIGRTRQAIAEAKSRILNRQQEFSRDVQAQMADVQRDTQSMLTRMQALSFDVANTEIKSPADGVIVGLATHTVGGVVQAGTVLMEVVPGDEPLKVEAQIAPHMIDKVKLGLPVDILFSAFNQAITPKVPGTVVSVSADVLFDPNSRQPYYKAQIVVTPEGMTKLRDHKIKAGMPAEVFVRTGERTAYNYLMKPLRDRLRAAMTEQ